MRAVLIVFATLLFAGCASGSNRGAASVTAAHSIDPTMLAASSRGPSDADYRIGVTDKLSVTVFQVPDLSLAEVQVDSAGNIQMPLIGTVKAADLTTSELSAVIARSLGERYLRNPQVTVIVKEAASQKVTVDGAVTLPGVYEMRGRTTLLQAVAMARGPLREADISSVAVFRETSGHRQVAVFDLRRIRNGELEDPVILGDDIVVVDTSRLNSVWRDIIQAAPALAVFQFF